MIKFQSYNVSTMHRKVSMSIPGQVFKIYLHIWFGALKKNVRNTKTSLGKEWNCLYPHYPLIYFPHSLAHLILVIYFFGNYKINYGFKYM